MVKLRQMVKEDVPCLYRMYLDYPEMVASGKVYGIDWLYKVAEDEGQFRFSIVAPDDPELLGLATLWWDDRSNGIMSPTMWIGKGFQRKGYGLAALKQLWSFGVMNVSGLRKMVGSVYGFNEPSLELCRKFFGQPEAIMPNQVFYGGKYWAQYYFAKYNRVSDAQVD